MYRRGTEHNIEGSIAWFLHSTGGNGGRKRIWKSASSWRRRREEEEEEEGDDDESMGAALRSDQYSSLWLQRPIFASPPLPFWLPHHLHYQFVLAIQNKPTFNFHFFLQKYASALNISYLYLVTSYKFASFILNTLINHCFLFPCLSEREKSATKEAISILDKVKVFSQILL